MTRRRVVVRVAIQVDDTCWQVSAALDSRDGQHTGAVLTIGGPAEGSPFKLYADRNRRVLTTEQRVPADALLAAATALRSGPIAERLYGPQSASLQVLEGGAA